MTLDPRLTIEPLTSCQSIFPWKKNRDKRQSPLAADGKSLIHGKVTEDVVFMLQVRDVSAMEISRVGPTMNWNMCTGDR